MNPLNPQPPFVWPEPRAIEETHTYDNQPPCGELALQAHALFGIVPALTAHGIGVLETWLERNPDLKACIIVVVYPACATRQTDLFRLVDVVKQTSGRLSVRISPLKRTTDRATNALCIQSKDSEVVWMATGQSEDLSMAPWQPGHVNFVFRADPALVEVFKRYFDWLWVKSREITGQGMALIPDLVLPEGTEEGAQLWRDYMNSFVDASPIENARRLLAHVDPDTGDVTIHSKDGQAVIPPSEKLGFEKLDQLAEQMARLYDKGALVSIDKLSRIPPLDAPLDPSLFGDDSEIQRGNVTRKVSMRVSVIDEKILKQIDKRRQGLRNLLTKFSFGLADNMRWMPATAQKLFESELKRVNEEGQKLVSDLLNGGVDAFIDAKRPALVSDINSMYVQLGRPGQVTEKAINQVVKSLKERLSKAHSANFMPKLSYSVIGFARTDNLLVSPWGQAFSLLASIVAFPRKALTDSFFFRGLKVPEDDHIEAMNVVDDALCRDLRARGIKGRCKAELDILSRIEKAPLESKKRCELVWRILTGDSISAIEKTLLEMQAG